MCCFFTALLLFGPRLAILIWWIYTPVYITTLFQTWIWPILIARGTLPAGTTIPPVLDGDVLFAMVSGLLGIAGMRSFDKMKGTDPKLVGR